VIRELALASLLAATAAPVAARQASAACATVAPTPAKQGALNEINRFRARNGRAALCYSARIDAAAQWMASDMAAKDYFSHTDSLGRDGGRRLSDSGYAWSRWGENIAAGQTTWRGAIAAWRNSPGHRANLLSARFREIGLGQAYGAASSWKYYWVADFGAPR
jgi:uncharacterized protein YkwD